MKTFLHKNRVFKTLILVGFLTLTTMGWGQYCTLTFTSTVEPITLVQFAGINKSTLASTSSPGYEDFSTSDIGNVVAGQTYPITLKGNTDGNYTNRFTVFIDFNGNGTLNDTGEMFEIGSIQNSTGTDVIELTGNITIPVSAPTGSRRMRVVKNFSTSPTNPCGSYSYGQAEDYTINIGAPCTPLGNQNTYGTNSWIGYVYTFTGTPSFISSNYKGYVTESETFDRDHGSGAVSGATSQLCSAPNDNFTVRYKMTKNFPAGYYIFTIGGDDGVRLSIDGGSSWLINQWIDQGYTTYSNTMSVFLSGNRNLIFEYYEKGGGARASFTYALAPPPNSACNQTIDHNGADWTISSNTTVSGKHINVGNFTVNAGITATVETGCPFEVEAINIDVRGTINGDGKGHAGGSGGAGGNTYGSCSNDSRVYYPGGGAGTSGNPGAGTGGGNTGGNGGNATGTSRKCGGFLCSGNADGHFGGGGGAGGGGGGAYGGSGGSAPYGARGGSFTPTDNSSGTFGASGSAKTAVGTQSGTDLVMGSGGSGGGGGGGSTGYAGTAGGAGGRGGGMISLKACNNLSMTGVITANGSNGANGGNGGKNGSINYNQTVSSCGNCGVCGEGTFYAHGGAGGGAGGGSGGGILLEAYGNSTITGILRANGGRGGNAGSPKTSESDFGIDYANGGGGGSGGRIKVFRNPCVSNNINPTTSITGGSGGTNGNGSSGSAGNSGTSSLSINHPDYTPLVAGNTTTTSYEVCYNTNPTSAINASISTGGAKNASLSCASSLPDYEYQWYVTKTACSTPTTGSVSNPNTGWSAITGATGQNLTAAQELAGINQVGSTTEANTYCFQRRTKSGNCYAWTSNVVSITIRPEINISITATNTEICQGETGQVVTITNNTTINTVVTYNGPNGNSNIAVNANSSNTINIDASNPGTFTYSLVSAIYQNSPDCSKNLTGSTTITVTPTANPGTIDGLDQLCEGASSVSYATNNTILGGGTTSWSSDNPSVATVTSNGFVSAVGPGTANIIYTITGGCGGDVSTSQLVQVDEKPIPPTSVTIAHNDDATNCHGREISITAIGGNAIGSSEFIWGTSPGGNNIATSGSTITDTPSASTTYHVGVTANGACAAQNGTANVTYNLPIAGNQLSGDNESATCYVEGTNPIHFYETTTGHYIGSIEPNGRTGLVTMISYITPANSSATLGQGDGTMYACDHPGEQFRTAYMDRSFVVTNEGSLSGNGSLQVTFPYSQDELNDLIMRSTTVTTLNITDDVAGHDDIVITKFEGPGENNIPYDNCNGLVLNGPTGSLGNPTINGVNYYVTVPVSSFSEFYLHGLSNNSPLPVQLISFTASCNANRVVSWATASELNNDYFILERSRNGEEWEEIATIDGQGNTQTTHNYSYTDNISNGVVYYQLRQIDYDGKETIYGPISSSCEKEENSWSIHPIPVVDKATVTVNSKNSGNGELVIVDNNGKVILAKDIKIEKGSTIYEVDASRYSKGVYMIYLKGVYGYKPLKFVKF